MSKVEHYDKIWSHAANQNYRHGVDRMICRAPGCKRWKVDEASRYCAEHSGSTERTAQQVVERMAGPLFTKDGVEP